MKPDEFYIGYEAEVPRAIARQVRRVVASIAAGLLIVAAGALAFHTPLQPARFDYGRPHRVEGVLTRRPYPALTVDGRTIGLVGQGKHGAAATLGATPEGGVRLEGATIARMGLEMLEVVPGSLSLRSGASPTSGADSGHTTATPSTEALGEEVTLTGEIVDSKCHLGVMNPGQGTVHRDCARLCLRGGIPPMLLTRDASGHESLVALVGADGRALGPEVASLAGQAIAVTGRLAHEAPPTLFADPEAFRRRAWEARTRNPHDTALDRQ